MTHAELVRQQLRADAAKIGVTEDFISDMVFAFYAKVRGHPVLGPVFDSAIGENWDAHLDTMTRFWCSVALNAGTYGGKPVAVHMANPAIQPQHFGVWLGLFQATLDDMAPTPAATAYMMGRAERIAANLTRAVHNREQAA
jgi:hemoglobin